MMRLPEIFPVSPSASESTTPEYSSVPDCPKDSMRPGLPSSSTMSTESPASAAVPREGSADCRLSYPALAGDDEDPALSEESRPRPWRGERIRHGAYPPSYYKVITCHS